MGCDQSMYATTPIYTVSGLCLICKQEKQIRKDYTRLRKRNKRKKGEVNTLDKGGEGEVNTLDKGGEGEEIKTTNINNASDMRKEGVCLDCCNNTKRGSIIWDKNYNVFYAFYKNQALEIKYKMLQHEYPHYQCGMCDRYYDKIYNLNFSESVPFPKMHSNTGEVWRMYSYNYVRFVPSICRSCIINDCKDAVMRMHDLHNEW